jgi:type I restriction enzyme S subunit
MMSKNKPLYPKLRFRGFTEAWEQRKLSQLGETYTSLTGKSKDDFGHGDAEYVTYMNVFANPISNPDMTDNIEPDASQNEVKKGDIFFTVSSETPEEVGMSSVWLSDKSNVYLNSFCFGFRPSKVIHSYFIAALLRAPKFRSKMKVLAQGISRYNISKKKVLDIEVSLPGDAEQERVGSLINYLDHTIALYQRKVDKLKELKKGYIQKLFPKAGASVPELRFPGFADPWEQRKLESLVTRVTREVAKPDHPYTRISVRSHAKGTFHQDVLDPSSVAMSKLFVVRENDLIVNITFAWEHAIAIANKSDDGLLVSHRFPTYLIDKSDIKFVHYLVSQESFRYKMDLISPGGAGRNRVLNQKDFVKILSDVPTNLEEQTKIGEMFDKLDHLIASNQRKVDKLKELKKGYMQQMFI